MRLSNYENLDLEPWQLDICKEYCENDMKLLKKSCYKMIKRKNLDGNEFYDDLIDEAMFVLIESVLTYDKEKNSRFEGYFKSNLARAFYDWSRDQGRECRTNYLCNENGIIEVKDKEDGKKRPVILPTVKLDAPIKTDKDGNELGVHEVVGDGFDLEEFVCNQDDGEYDKWHPETLAFLHKLSPLQREIALMLANRYEREEICEILHITTKIYDNSFKRICREKNTKILMNLSKGVKHHD